MTSLAQALVTCAGKVMVVTSLRKVIVVVSPGVSVMVVTKNGEVESVMVVTSLFARVGAVCDEGESVGWVRAARTGLVGDVSLSPWRAASAGAGVAKQLTTEGREGGKIVSTSALKLKVVQDVD